jgi:flagellar protein FlgJ
MNNTITPNVLDINGLTALKHLAHGNDPAAVKAAAQQFEGLFLQQVMQAMRDATPQDGPFDDDQTRMVQSLLDQQMAQVMATKSGGTGLAALIEKQLAAGGAPADSGAATTLPNLLRLLRPAAANAGEGPSTSAGEFLQRIQPLAQQVSRTTGIPAHFVAAQAALESGWGEHEPRTKDGRRSFNLFGIKAGDAWNGAVAEASTTEVVSGLAQKRVERFRAYGSYAEAFQDYAALLTSNPRYAGVLGARDAASFAREMQRAGYASDPNYATKLHQLILAGDRRPLPTA